MPPKFRGTRGVVGIIANDAARFSEFAACVTRLEVPPGWDIEWVIGGDWCSARNALAQHTLDNDYTHLWFMDDDHAFAPDLLMKLLRHDVPLVNPMCLTRTYPFQPVTYLEEGALDLASVPERGLVELHAGGTAGMLIRRDVLEAVEAPWFVYSDRSEDVIFCEKAQEAGFALYADLEARLGHITTAVVWPTFTGQHGWMTGLTIGKEMQVTIPLTGDLLERGITRIDAPISSDVVVRLDEGLGVVPETTGAGFVPERAELWLDEADQRWHARLLNEQGVIVRKVGPWPRERDATDSLQVDYTGVPIFFINNELDDSRRDRKGPPLRLWDHRPIEEG